MPSEKEQNESGHRLARVRISLEQIERWITDGTVIAAKCESGLKSPRIRDVRWRTEDTNSAELLIEDETLPVVPEGYLIPAIPVAFHQLHVCEKE